MSLCEAILVHKFNAHEHHCENMLRRKLSVCTVTSYLDCFAGAINKEKQENYTIATK